MNKIQKVLVNGKPRWVVTVGSCKEMVGLHEHLREIHCPVSANTVKNRLESGANYVQAVKPA